MFTIPGIWESGWQFRKTSISAAPQDLPSYDAGKCQRRYLNSLEQNRVHIETDINLYNSSYIHLFLCARINSRDRGSHSDLCKIMMPSWCTSCIYIQLQLFPSLLWKRMQRAGLIGSYRSWPQLQLPIIHSSALIMYPTCVPHTPGCT